MSVEGKALPNCAHKRDLPYAIITGASEGIGAEFARQLALRGTHSIILVARSVDKLNKVKADLNELLASASLSSGNEARPLLVDLPLDLSLAESAELLNEKTKNLPVTLLIANAGTAVAGIFEAEEMSRLRTMNALNVTGVAELVAVFLPRMKKSLDGFDCTPRTHALGGLITLSSVAGLMPVPSMAAYGASKAYILSLSEAIHHEQKVLQTGLHVTCVLPGPTRSALWSLDGGKPSKVLVPWTTAEQVVRAALHAFDRNTAVVIPGISNQLAAFSLRLAPKFLVRRIASVAMNQWPADLESRVASRKKPIHKKPVTEQPSAKGMLVAAFALGLLLIMHGIPSLLPDPSAPYRWLYRTAGWMSADSDSLPFLMTFRTSDDRLFLHERVEQIPGLYRVLHVIPAIVWSCGMPFQHMASVRKNYPRFHRWNGYLLFSISLLLMSTGLLFLLLGSTYSEKGLFTLHHIPNHPWLIYPTFDQYVLLVSAMQGPTLFLALRAARQRQFARHQYWATMFTIASYIIHLDRLGFMLMLLVGRTLQLLPPHLQKQLPASTEDKMTYELIAFQLSATLGVVIGLVWALHVHRAYRRRERQSSPQHSR